MLILYAWIGMELRNVVWTGVQYTLRWSKPELNKWSILYTDRNPPLKLSFFQPEFGNLNYWKELSVFKKHDKPLRFENMTNTFKASFLLVDIDVVFLLGRKPKHATDDSGIFCGPISVTDPFPDTIFFYFHIPFCDGQTLAGRTQDSMDSDIFHLDIYILGRKIACSE